MLALEELGGDFHDVVRRFTFAEDDLGKPSSQRPVSIHLGKAEVCYWRCLKCPHDFIAADTACPELFQEFHCFRRGHPSTLP